MCLCGMLASDFETLPPGVQERVSDFFERSYTWLERVIDDGVADGPAARDRLLATRRRSPSWPGSKARCSSPAHPSRPGRFDRIADALLASLGVPTSV